VKFHLLGNARERAHESVNGPLIVLYDDIHFSPIFLKVKSMKTVQMFFEDCVASS